MMKRSDRTSITSIALSLRATRIAKHFMGELVEHVEHPILASIMGAVLDKVVGPDMIALLQPQRNARSIAQSLPRLGCFGGTFSPSRRQK
jgi:hypothetical protein